MMNALRGSLILVVVFGSAALAGCQPRKPPTTLDYSAPLPPGVPALRKIAIEEYPDFRFHGRNLPAIAASIRHSLAYMGKPSSRSCYPQLDIDHARAVATLQALWKIIDEQSAPAGDGERIIDLNAIIRQDFEVYKSVGAPDGRGGFSGRVLFTGYCTPIYEASLKKEGPYRWPVYKLPADLVTNPANADTVGRKTRDGSVVPYYTRAEIEGQNKLAGNELLYLKTRWEAYMVNVQGSARLKLTDGSTMEIGYAGTNGREYSSPGERMLADGVITRDQRNNRDMVGYFTAHPEAMDKYLWVNERFVFFTQRPGGPFGCLNVPVTPFASIATDKKIAKGQAVYPPAMPAFLVVPIPTLDGKTVPFRSFMMDQDTGGAIRAAGRCDIYMGVGPEAEKLSGNQLNEGELYYIAVKMRP